MPGARRFQPQMGAAGQTVGVVPGATSDSDDEDYDHYAKALAAATASKGMGVPRDSLYGSAIVLPQVARNLKWNPVYVGKVCKCFMSLAICILVQFMFVYQIWKLVKEQTMACDEDPEECVQNGFRRRHGLLFKHWYLCSAEVHWLRKICVLAFIVTMFKDARQSFEMFRLMYALPSEKGDWLVVTETEEITARKDKGGARTSADYQVGYQVEGMTSFWKVLNIVLFLVPKLIIWVGLFWNGSIWLMNTPDRDELILNAVSLVFVIDFDEVLYAAVTESDTQQRMEDLQSWKPEPEQTSDGEPSSTDSEGEKSTSRAKTILRCSFDALIFQIVLAVLSFIGIELYEEACIGN